MLLPMSFVRLAMPRCPQPHPLPGYAAKLRPRHGRLSLPLRSTRLLAPLFLDSPSANMQRHQNLGAAHQQRRLMTSDGEWNDSTSERLRMPYFACSAVVY